MRRAELRLVLDLVICQHTIVLQALVDPPASAPVSGHFWFSAPSFTAITLTACPLVQATELSDSVSFYGTYSSFVVVAPAAPAA